MQTMTRSRAGGIRLPGLRRARHDAGLTLRDLEARTETAAGRKVYASTISDLENSKRGAQGVTARALAKALGVTVRDLRR